MNKVFLILPLIVVIVVSGCVQRVSCNPPYILVGEGCCLDLNENNICDTDEEAIETTTTTLSIPETTVNQRRGSLNVREDFFVSCMKSSTHEEWCSAEFVNGINIITIDTASLGAQENNVAEIATWVSNEGSSDIEGIKYDITCDQTSPTEQENVITKNTEKYKTISLDEYFRCFGCILGCECTPQRYGQIIERLKPGDETTFRIEMIGLKYFPEEAVLDCNVRIYSDNPVSEHISNLIINLGI
jgi:hypothetical protein